MKERKCQFVMAEHYLGYRVGSGKGDLIVVAIEQFRVPTTKKQVHSFMGMAGYYCKFIHQYAAEAVPLTYLTHKNTQNDVVWTSHRVKPHILLVEGCLALELRSPDFSQPFLLQTNSSDREVGGILSQLDQNGHDKPTPTSVGNCYPGRGIIQQLRRRVLR